MRRHIRFLWKGVGLTLVVAMCVLTLNKILLPKEGIESYWALTAAYKGFYEMERDTVDVLFLGSSHTMSFFIPQELYNEYGITSYNWGSNMQSMGLSYFLLREALRYQRPSAVVLDSYRLFQDFYGTEGFNTGEVETRKVLDNMRWSPVKIQAVAEVCSYDKSQSQLSYYLTNIRFHSKWQSMDAASFLFGGRPVNTSLRGYAPYVLYTDNNTEGIAYQPYERTDTQERAEMHPVEAEYLDRIVSLCEKEGIALILVKTPAATTSAEKSAAVLAYAEERGIPFLDYNEAGLYREIGYDYQSDSMDAGHGAFSGAVKVTGHVGAVLRGEYGMQGRIDSQYEETRDFYENFCKDEGLKRIEDIHDYLRAVNDPRYTVFIVGKEEFTFGIDEALMEELHAFGIEENFVGETWSSYWAVFSEEGREELRDYALLTKRGAIDSGGTSYEIISASSQYGNLGSVKIEGMERAVSSRGLNFVVYSNEMYNVVDSVCFDTFSTDYKAVR